MCNTGRPITFQYFYSADEEVSSNEASDESVCESSEDEEDDDWFDHTQFRGNPLNRKRFFVFSKDRTLNPKYNMVGEYMAIRNERQQYVLERCYWIQRKEFRAGCLSFRGIKPYYDVDLSDCEDDEV